MAQSDTIELTGLILGALGVGILGFLILVISWIVLIVKGFGASAGWGLLVLLVPFGVLIFGIAKWSRAGGALVANLLAMVMFVGSGVVIVNSPQIKDQLEKSRGDEEQPAPPRSQTGDSGEGRFIRLGHMA